MAPTDESAMDFQGIKRRYPILFLGSDLIPDRILNCVLSAQKEKNLFSLRESKVNLSDFFIFTHPKYLTELKNFYLEEGCESDYSKCQQHFPVWIINGSNLGNAEDENFLHFPVRLSQNEDEIRTKIINCVEMYRQNIFEKHILKQLSAKSAEAHNFSAVHLDLYRLVHAICCFLNLSPHSHLQTMQRLSSKIANDDFSGWEASKDSADWIIGSCHLALQSVDSSIQFKEKHRILSKNLPFKARSDIRDAIENCLLHFWRQENAS